MGGMSMGKSRRDRQPTMWVMTTDLPTAASHPFYRRLNQLLREHGFDDFAEAQVYGLNRVATDCHKLPFRCGSRWHRLNRRMRVDHRSLLVPSTLSLTAALVAATFHPFVAIDRHAPRHCR
jgi:hypothetical protein